MVAIRKNATGQRSSRTSLEGDLGDSQCMEIRIDIDEKLLHAASPQERQEFQTALFCAASEATSRLGAKVDFSDPLHWVITHDDGGEGPTGCMDDGDELGQALRGVSHQELNRILDKHLW